MFTLTFVRVTKTHTTYRYNGKGRSAAMVILASSELTKTGQAIDVGNDQVVMFRVEGYEPGTSFPPGYNLEFKVKKPSGALIENPCCFYDDVTDPSAPVRGPPPSPASTTTSLLN
jgi:hypothetical protein